MIKPYRKFMQCLLLFAALIISEGPAKAQSQSPEAAAQLREKKNQDSYAAFHQKRLQELLKQFKAQTNKDELYLLTQNSFFEPKMSPLAGCPVLLVVGVHSWNKVWDKYGQREAGPDVVRFKIVRGKGYLATFPELKPGQVVDPQKPQSLEVYDREGAGEAAYIWLVTDPTESGEVVVEARLVAKGECAPYIDPKSRVELTVSPVAKPEGWNYDALPLKEAEYQNILKPSAQIQDNYTVIDIAHAPVTARSLATLWDGKSSVIYQEDNADPQQMKRAVSWTEKEDVSNRAHSWNYYDKNLQGLVTHMDVQDNRFGMWIQTFPARNDEKNEMAEYLINNLPAGPERSVFVSADLLGKERPPYGEAYCKVVESFQPLLKDGVYGWGLVKDRGGILFGHPFYDQLNLKVTRFLAGAQGLSADKLKDLLAQEPGQPDHPLLAPVTEFQSSWGLAYQDVSPELQKRLPAFGHPPGAVVTEVTPQSAADTMGLVPDDIILNANGLPVHNASDLSEILKGLDPANEMVFIYWRDGVMFSGWINPFMLGELTATPH
jgi:hypothetical protein